MINEGKTYMMDLISVIVPVYNVESYLQKCLDSIIDQTYSNLEIIIIDDGSKDRSGEICDYYKNIDSRIKVVHKQNGGLSDARNIGIDISVGEYICFVDSDDYLEKNYVLKMYEKIKDKDIDICCCGKFIESENICKVVNSDSDFILDSVEALKYYLQKKEIDNSAVDKLYRKKMFDDVRFPAGMYYEDIGTIYKLFLKAKKIAHIDIPLYHYVMRKGSISHGVFSKKQLESLYMTREAVKCINQVYPELNEYLAAYYGLEMVTTIRQMYYYWGKKETVAKYSDIIQEYKNNFKSFIHSPYIPFFKKIMMWLIKFQMYRVVNLMIILFKKEF